MEDSFNNVLSVIYAVISLRYSVPLVCFGNKIVTGIVCGVNSFLIIQSRLLVTLFEVAHGFYPAAYV